MSMRYLSVCSGIEAASVAWRPLDWEAIAVAEVEAFPSAVLAHHYPAVPNWGDITKFREWPDAAIDILVGGTPCQSFSVAGLRGGLADERGNLTLEFLRLAQRVKPAWIVWENVPGVISDKTNALPQFLDGLEELGYIVDIDILDAQWFGLAQRRKRVFVCGQHRDDILKAKTPSSALTIIQCLAEICRLILAARSDQLKVTSENWAFDATKPRLSLQRRMKLFGLHGAEAASTLVENLVALPLSFGCARGVSGYHRGRISRAGSRNSGDTRSHASSVEMENYQGAFQNTEVSLKKNLDDILQIAREFTTSTCENGTTGGQIYTCSQLLANIAARITQSTDSSPSFWSAASSTLTALKEFTSYARSANSDLLAGLDGIHPWGDFIEQAERSIDAIGNLRVEQFGKILPVSESLSGHPAPRREARERGAPTISSRPTGGGGLGTDFDCDGGLIASSLNAHPSCSDGESETFIATVASIDATNIDRGDSQHLERLVAHTLRGEGHDATEDRTGRGTPIVPVGVTIHGTDKTARAASLTDIAGALRARAPGGQENSSTTAVMQPTFLHLNKGRPQGRKSAHTEMVTLETETTPTLTSDGHAQSAIAFDARQSDVIQYGNMTGPLDTDGHTMAVAFTQNQLGDVLTGDVMHSLGTNTNATGRNAINVQHNWAVRRLTPTECERLQGFPDSYTAINFRGKPAADGNRYKALGNSFAVNVIRWIGQRIAQVDKLPTLDQTPESQTSRVRAPLIPMSDGPDRAL